MLNSQQIILATLAFFATQGEALPLMLEGHIDALDEEIENWYNDW